MSISCGAEILRSSETDSCSGTDIFLLYLFEPVQLLDSLGWENLSKLFW